MKTIPLANIADIAGSPIRPSNFPSESFSLYSIPAYLDGMPEVVLGNMIGSNKTIIHNGQVLISKLNPRIPRVWLVSDFNGNRQICSTEFIPFQVKDSNKTDPEWLLYTLLAPQFIEPLQNAVRSSTKSHQRVRPNDIAQQRVPFIPFDVQRRIVARIKECLERVEEIEKLRVAAIEEANNIFRSHCEEIFSAGWPETAVGDLITDKPSNGIFKRRKDFGNGTLLANVKDLYVDQIIHTEQLERVQASEKEIQQFQLEPGDILVNRSSLKREGTGRSCVFVGHSEPVLFECHIMRVRLDQKKLHPALFAAFMNSPIGLNRILNRAKTATMTTWNQTDLQSIMIPIPTIDLQAELVDELGDIKTLADELRISMESAELKYLRDSILRKAFVGEL